MRGRAAGRRVAAVPHTATEMAARPLIRRRCAAPPSPTRGEGRGIAVGDLASLHRRHTQPLVSDLDVLIIGGGHNGLVCAAYLAGAGLKVRVLERRAVAGGAAVTEEFQIGRASCRERV